MNVEPKTISSVLVKPAGPDCNMTCKYCFYLEKADLFSHSETHRMSDTILEKTVRQVMTQGGPQVSFAWQGGEPTLMGIEFFERAVELQKRYGFEQIVDNSLQTNGILVDSDWAVFLEENKFLVGLSLDGPEHVHDHYRFLSGGQKSWTRVVESAKRMLDHGVAVNALTVVNDYSARYPQEIYEFHKDLGLTYMQFIPCVETDQSDPSRAAPYSVSPEDYGGFLCTLFDLWTSDFVGGVPTTYVRYFESVFFNYVNMPPPECTLMQSCGVYVVVEHNGDVYSCDFFVDPEWKLGNVLDGALADTLNSERQFQFGQLKTVLPEECEECKWLRYCWGGCTKDRIRDPTDNNSNHFCGSYKMFFEHADARLGRLAENWQQKRSA